ncbi:Fe-only nitrogenase accessory protein AnfO [Clostridium formicaceticum]|uniref:Fe-only nitrogenase accessory protein AnfO n=1 Tax=Clostridium formicaceticum TaxID=1497 RepID=A0AAC9RN78_9CLOT|nr:Fe-only nitrogenase accessory protein AnfO [Clostridium formicaceticum]AOY78128.1 Fe-only nitrogenase accessory protein AnfO [Clostridium formicaceticum]ARE88779.1 Iron only nitrogenase protein AnfO (AnfO_nitrog) [Clostridium formicaceticum]
MSREIAVFLDDSKHTSVLFESGWVNVYKKVGGEWRVVKTFSFSLDSTKGMAGVRRSLAELVRTLGDSCKIFVAKEITGLIYTVLDTEGFSLWELDGEPEMFLDTILEKEEDVAEGSGEEEILGPVETDKKGYYFIDLKTLQQSSTGITSKQALLFFLRNQSFYELKVICAHIPKWFEGEFQKLNLKANIDKKENGDYHILVYKKTCMD